MNHDTILVVHDLMIDHERISSDDQQPYKSFMIDHEIMNGTNGKLLDVPQSEDAFARAMEYALQLRDDRRLFLQWVDYGRTLLDQR